MCRALRWPEEREQQAGAEGIVEDIHDSELWARFLADNVLNNNIHPDGAGLPVLRIALALCGDGVEANRGKQAKANTVTCLACCILNLPPWLRSKLPCSLLCTCLPGPGEPRDAQPYLDIPTDELVYMYEVGVVTWDASRCAP